MKYPVHTAPGYTPAAAQADAAEITARCRELAAITDIPGQTTRTFLSEAIRRANARVTGWMTEAGLTVRTDDAGNLRGRLPSHDGPTPVFVIASHLDTVPNAGAFDGVLGVLLGIALAKRFATVNLPFSLEIIGFSEEEGVRFAAPFLGSRAIIGELTGNLLDRKDHSGTTVHQAIQNYGLNPAGIPQARLQDALGYLEFHIEQGPALEDEGLPLGIVETIAGQSRFDFRFTGNANHAGTTPMHLRHDALAAAAEWIVAVERYAKEARAVIATVGRVIASPNAGNVIAGEVRATLDVRSALDTTRAEAVTALLAAAQACAAERGVRVTSAVTLEQSAVAMDRGLITLLEDAVDAIAPPIRRITSGAGHDAMIVAPHMPAAMLFLRTPGGISHHPAESVTVDDVALALRVGERFLQSLAEQEISR